MPIARSGDFSLYYESTGAGAGRFAPLGVRLAPNIPPVLLIMGLGMNATGWWRTIPVLAGAGLRVLAFDNRGAGRSDRPPGPYSTDAMADDAVAVLDAAGVEGAHIYGISLGGMIAQKVALRHPGRVERLVLGATTPGGPHATAADAATVAFFHRRGQMSPEEAVWASVPYNYSARTRTEHGDRIAGDIAQRLRFPIEPEAYAAQLAGSLGHDTGERLASIASPTLVVHGSEDVMVPPANGRLLADRIPEAELMEIPGAAHLYPTDDPAADRRIAEFLTAPNGASGAPPPR